MARRAVAAPAVLVPAGLAGMLLGAWGPWLAHASAGLAYGVLDLAEFVKLMARAGLTAVVREWFFLPMLAAAIGLALWLPSLGQALGTGSLRWKVAALGLAAPWPLVVLPPYPGLLQAYAAPEDRLSFGLGLASLGLVVASAGLGQRLPPRALAGALAGLALGSTLPAAWQFARLAGPLAELYGAPPQVGWGLLLTLLGASLLGLGGGLAARQRGPCL